MISELEVEIKMGTYLMVHYQFRQIRNLVDFLRAQYEVFRPPKGFDIGINVQNKLLSKLYKLLLSSQLIKDSAI